VNKKVFIKINESYPNLERTEIVPVRATGEFIYSFLTLEMSVTMAKLLI
jgi:hypothetical protein